MKQEIRTDEHTDYCNNKCHAKCDGAPSKDGPHAGDDTSTGGGDGKKPCTDENECCKEDIIMGFTLPVEGITEGYNTARECCEKAMGEGFAPGGNCGLDGPHAGDDTSTGGGDGKKPCTDENECCKEDFIMGFTLPVEGITEGYNTARECCEKA